MIELQGKYTTAKIFADTIEQGVIKQTLDLCNHPIFEDARIRIMPDCHEGKGCTIGFTSTMPKGGEIIPNIIGVDVHCFTGDTKVKLVDGRSLSFLELIKEDAEGKTNYCYCLDDSRRIQISKISAPRKIGTTNKLCIITLDDGKEVKCTPDHKFYGIDGILYEAQNLKVGQSLFPLYLDFANSISPDLLVQRFHYKEKDEHLVVFQPTLGKYEHVHIISDSYNERLNPEILDRKYEGKKSFVRHHIDFNKLNNNPSNIQRVSYKNHWKIHHENVKTTNKLGCTGFKKAAEYDSELYSKAGKLGAKATFDNSRNGIANRKAARERLNSWNKTEARKLLNERVRIRQLTNNTTKFSAQNKSEDFILLQKTAKLSKILNKCLELYGSVSEENYNKARKMFYNGYTFEKANQLKSQLGKSFEEIATYKNHKIKKIEIIDVFNEDVYCLTNHEFGNFALDAGVFVKNCGMLAARIRNEEIDFKDLDKAIMNHVPFGMNGRKSIASHLPEYLIEEVCRYNTDFLNRGCEDDLLKIGSLGGGNHFISIEKGSTGSWLIIHSGSRNFGNAMARYFQDRAIETNFYGSGELKQLSYLTGKDAEDYMNFMKVAGLYASRSRAVMMQKIMRNTELDLDITSVFETIHNYIGEDGIIRKGAISCKENEKVLIPINMAYGSFIAIGKGNEEWNSSGPHGAGRVLSRSKAKEQLSMEEYKESMKNVYSSRILQSTLDEAPMAYKDGDEIKNLIEPTAEIIDHLIPMYNFKG